MKLLRSAWHGLKLLVARGVGSAIDALVLAVPVAAAYLVFASVVGLTLDLWMFELVCIAIALAAIEARRRGRTIGAFALGTIAVSARSGGAPDFYESLVRHCSFFLLVPALILIGSLVDEWSNLAQFPVSGYAIGVWSTLLSGYPIIRSGSRVGFHDLLAGTWVKREGSRETGPDLQRLRRESYYLVVLLVAAHVALVLGARGALPTYQSDFRDSGLQRELATLETTVDVPSTRELGRGIPDLFSYYADSHGIMGILSLSDVERNLRFSRAGLEVMETEQNVLPAFQVFVTMNGLTTTKFQEVVAANLSRSVFSETGTQYFLVEYVYVGDLLGITYPVLKKRVLAGRPAATGPQIPLLISPSQEWSVATLNRRPEDFEVMLMSLGDLQRRAP
jgi:hypothetical protein